VLLSLSGRKLPLCDIIRSDLTKQKMFNQHQ
jgi:hypothetical protein